MTILPGVSELPKNALGDYRPDFLITGTSAGDFTERYLWEEASRLNIKSMAVLDSWINYGVRFSRYGLKDLHLFDGKCDYLPNYICVMDDIAKEDMIKEGAPEDLIVVLGNPHFENIALQARELEYCKQNKQKIIGDKYIIIFASQLFEDAFRKGSEIQVLEDLIEITKDRDDIFLLIRKHSKEPIEKFQKYLCEKVRLDNNPSVMTTILSSDMVVSVNSMVLIEATFCNKRILSYQPKAIDKNDFILTRNNTIPFITKKDEFKKYFYELLNTDDSVINNTIISSGIISRITKFVEEQVNA
ncbi:hypothetical protein FACS1894137_01060 [Spirochaetia bacterium]|nr:hypothetical protein FACS1894137_01060 [Spirochaetia bacterium]